MYYENILSDISDILDEASYDILCITEDHDIWIRTSEMIKRISDELGVIAANLPIILN